MTSRYRLISRFLSWLTIFHPDYTVGPGVSPDHALRKIRALAGFTADRELRPLTVMLGIPVTPSLTLPRRLCLFICDNYNLLTPAGQ